MKHCPEEVFLALNGIGRTGGIKWIKPVVWYSVKGPIAGKYIFPATVAFTPGVIFRALRGKKAQTFA